ncbi:hypothetical protein EYF80_001507 [Liparis tanakae]|uniref:Uncharacterized protein n=1 Tax=Liparis tanakae TaxID=230148 RepID=A0A4Z2JE54_9TELE|nr:hypothetical protein EYF80_001507 [Liparis tanakae]
MTGVPRSSSAVRLHVVLPGTLPPLRFGVTHILSPRVSVDVPLSNRNVLKNPVLALKEERGTS